MSCIFCRFWASLTRSKRIRQASELLGCQEFEINNNGAMIAMKHGAFAAVASDAVEMLDESGAVNYITIEACSHGGRRVTITIQRNEWGALTPHRKAEVATRHLESVLEVCKSKDPKVTIAKSWLNAQKPTETAVKS